MSNKLLEDENSHLLENVNNLFEQNEIDQAISLLQKHLQENPDNVQVLHILGTACARKHDFLKAEKYFKKVLKLNNSRVDAYFNLGLIHSQQNRLPEAKSDFENVIKLNPDDASALNDLGVIHYNLGEIDKGHDCFARALSIDPANKDAFLNLFELSWNEEKYSLALEYAYNFLKKLSPENAKNTISEDIEESKPGVSSFPRQSIKIYKSSPDKNLPSSSVSLQDEVVISSSEKIEIFNQHVPDNLKDKKTGMNIVYLADRDDTGQLSLLFKMINEKSIHRARYVAYQKSVFTDYNDLIYSESDREQNDLIKKIITNADFIHTGIVDNESFGCSVFEHLRSDNSLVHYFNQDIDNAASTLRSWHNEKNIYGLFSAGYTSMSDSQAFYHINPMYDSSIITPSPKPEGTIKIFHETSDVNSKDTELFMKVIEELQQKYDIEPIVANSCDRQECLRLKSQSHMTFEHLYPKAFGMSAIESLAFGHIVFSGISNFNLSVHPDIPVVGITKGNLLSRIQHFLTHRTKILELGAKGISWVKLYHDPDKIFRQYLCLYDFIRQGRQSNSNQDNFSIG